MQIVSVNEARSQLSDLMAQVAYGGQRVIVERRGKPLVAWISIEELRTLENLENEADQRRILRMQALDSANLARQQILAELGGAPLPDSSEVIARLREERTDELAGMC